MNYFILVNKNNEILSTPTGGNLPGTSKGVWLPYKESNNKETFILPASRLEVVNGEVLCTFYESANEKLVNKITKNTKIAKGFDYNELNYQIDPDSRLNIVGKALELQLGSTVQNVNWISNTQDKNGNDIINTFTREEFIEFAKAVAAYYESIVLKGK